jgi:hypothetical protein
LVYRLLWKRGPGSSLCSCPTLLPESGIRNQLRTTAEQLDMVWGRCKCWKEELGFTLIHMSMAAPPDLWTLGRCSLAAVQKWASKIVKTTVSESSMYACGQGNQRRVTYLSNLVALLFYPSRPGKEALQPDHTPCWDWSCKPWLCFAIKPRKMYKSD